MLCLDAAKGDVIWRVNLVDEHNAPLSEEEGLSSTPLVDGARLLVQAGRTLYALDKSSGELLWQALDEPMSHASPAIVTLDGRRQLLVLTAGNLVGLSPEDGREIWRHEQQAVNIANPVVGPGNRIFAGAAYGYGCQLIEVRGASARQVYKNAVLGSHHATPILHDGHLYGFDDRNGIFKCVEFATGEEIWEAREVGKGNIVLADGQLIVINEEGDLLLAPVSPEGFHPTARARVLRGTCYTAPSLADGRLYLRSDGELVCISLRD
jgi:outer membrane protein assembly factor BamB